MQNEEGGIVEEEFRVAYVVDRVNTFGTAFLGLTFECCRCHDHKFDPITQKDFYSLFAFFQNIDESGQTIVLHRARRRCRRCCSRPTSRTRRLPDLQRKIAAKEEQLRPPASAARIREAVQFAQWLGSAEGDPDRTLPGSSARSISTRSKDNKVANAADPKKPGNAVEGPKLVDGKSGKAAELNGENGFTFPGVGHFTRADPFTPGPLAPRRPTTPRGSVVAAPQQGPDRRRQPRVRAAAGGRPASPSACTTCGRATR